jgi:polar amino acid transport system permease protein
MFSWDTFWYFLFRDPDLSFLHAAWTTLWLSVVAQFLGVVLGLILALMYRSRRTWLREPARSYIWFFRGSPLLVQVLLLWDGLPRLFPSLLLPNFACILVAFSLNEGAYMAEIIRAGINSVDSGQMEAGKALGMRTSLAMRRIVLPQAARVIVPPLGNEFNNMLKTTSIASVIGVYELTNVATIYGSQNFTIFELLILATLYYLVLTTLWGYFQRWLEKRIDPDRNGRFPIKQKPTVSRLFGLNFNRSGETVGTR